MNVLSMFDGMSGGQLSFQRAGLKVDKYYSCEIDKYAQAVTKANFPDTIFLGDVTKVDFSKLTDIDVVIAGSPCQDLSFAGKGKGLEGNRSSLFYKVIEAIKVCKPEYFLLENVKMKKEYQDIISSLLKVEPVFINSKDFSAQNRQRLYWTNIPVRPWTDKGLVLKDILESVVDAKYETKNKNNSYKSQANNSFKPNDKFQSLCAGTHGYANGHIESNQLLFTGGAFRGRYDKDGSTSQRLEIRKDNKSNALTTVQKDSVCIQVGEADLKGYDSIKRVYSPEGKAPTLTTCGGGHREPKVYVPPLKWRKLTPIECERLQTVPDNYTSTGIMDGKEVKISNTQRYKMLGNGWTIDVIAHIFESLQKGEVW